LGPDTCYSTNGYHGCDRGFWELSRIRTVQQNRGRKLPYMSTSLMVAKHGQRHVVLVHVDQADAAA
jgi:hypothetical protein